MLTDAPLNSSSRDLGTTGRCHADLQQDTRAERLLRRSSNDLWDTPHQRNRAAWSLRLAGVLARERKLDEACEVGSQVLDVVVSLGSRRIAQQVRELWLQLEGSRDVPMVRDLGDRIAAILGDPSADQT